MPQYCIIIITRTHTKHCKWTANIEKTNFKPNPCTWNRTISNRYSAIQIATPLWCFNWNTRAQNTRWPLTLWGFQDLCSRMFTATPLLNMQCCWLIFLIGFCHTDVASLRLKFNITARWWHRNFGRYGPHVKHCQEQNLEFRLRKAERIIRSFWNSGIVSLKGSGIKNCDEGVWSKTSFRNFPSVFIHFGFHPPTLKYMFSFFCRPTQLLIGRWMVVCKSVDALKKVLTPESCHHLQEGRFERSAIRTFITHKIS